MHMSPDALWAVGRSHIVIRRSLRVSRHRRFFIGHSQSSRAQLNEGRIQVGHLVHQEGSREARHRMEVGLRNQQAVRRAGNQAVQVLRVQIQAGQNHLDRLGSRPEVQIQGQALPHPEQGQSSRPVDHVQPVERHPGQQRELRQCSGRQLQLQVA